MIKNYILFLFLLLSFPLLGLTPEGDGIKSAPIKIKFFNSISENGLKSLQMKSFSNIYVRFNENYKIPSFVSGKLTSAGYSKSSNRVADAIRFLSENIEFFGLKDPANELKVISNETDQLGYTHIKFQQYVNGIKVFKGQLVVHFKNDGSISAVNGRYYPTPEFNSSSMISSSAAIQIAKGKNSEKNLDINKVNAELTLYERKAKFYLAYEVHLPSIETPKMTVFIDAETGEIIFTDNGIRYDGPQVGTGVGLNGQTKTINTYLSGGKYYMINASLPIYIPPIDSEKGVIDVYDAYNDTSGEGYKSAAMVVDPNNDNNFDDSLRLRAAVDAQYFVLKAYDFYMSHFNRNSFDNKGSSLISFVHYKSKFNNALWNGNSMAYGDGDSIKFSNFAGGYDVIVHEFTHGVTQETSQLIYQDQSGALNESMSDVFSCLADSTNWLLGEDVFTPEISGDALRNMLHPHNNSSEGSSTWQPENMNEYRWLYDDNGGVHLNSGIPNRAFALTAQTIGFWKAGQIWYRGQTTYLTNSAEFIDARYSFENAAKDLYGDGSDEMKAVSDAFETVGIIPNSDPYNYLIYDDGSPDTCLYEQAADWEIGVKFSSPSYCLIIDKVQIYISGYQGLGSSYVLKLYDFIKDDSLHFSAESNPLQISNAGWQNISSFVYSIHDFLVSVKYDGINMPLLGADPPPGNQRTYEYNPNNKTWTQLKSPNDYTIFMRVHVELLPGVYEMSNEVPRDFEISQNFPNPFNPTTTIRFALPKGEFVKLSVYDIKGQKIADLVNNYQEPGTYNVTWNGKNSAGQTVSSGIYFYKFDAGNFSKSYKMIFIK